MPDNNHLFSGSHGGNIFEAARHARCRPEQIIDFSASINPLGPPAGLGSRLADSLWKISHYPAPGSPGLVRSAAKRFGIDPEMILAANGATELLDLAPRAFGCVRVLIPVPAYSGYAQAAAKSRCRIKHFYPGKHSGTLFPRLEDISEQIRDQTMVFLGRPGNPTGHLPCRKTLIKIMTAKPGAFFVIDESFLDFTREKSLAGSLPPNAFVVYSLTKFYALPGLRLGLGMGRPEVVSRIAALVSPWSVNTLAQEAGIFCLESPGFREKSRKTMSGLKKKFLAGLNKLRGLQVLPGEANFLLCRITLPGVSARNLADQLIRHRILIRPADNFLGLDEQWFRLAVKTEQHNSLLCSTLEQILSGPRPAPPKSAAKATPALMVLGTSSGAGKSILAAALGRILRQDGVNVAPFKAQNMSLNSFVTVRGEEMGRAQVVQARACGIEPDARMNPVLLKPSSDTGSQVIVMGKPLGSMEVNQYILFKEKLFHRVKSAYDCLASEHEVIILEGAGSPAEINLKKHDLVNMNMARHARARALLVGDIDRGGVFASFVGTMALLRDWEKELVAGLVINKFRGQKDLLQSAVDHTAMVTGRRVLGVIPYVHSLGLPEEDSLAFKNSSKKNLRRGRDTVNIGIIDLPHISNFTDFDPLYPEPDVELEIIRNRLDFHDRLDVVILPGSKNVPADLRALRESGLDRLVFEYAGIPDREIVGVCGGMQMLGLGVNDPWGVESGAVYTPGLGLLPLETEIRSGKTLKQVAAFWNTEKKIPVRGYEIHHGRTTITGKVTEPVPPDQGRLLAVAHPDLPVWGTYIHGIFDSDEFRRFWLDRVRARKGLNPLGRIQTSYELDPALDRLAGVVRDNLDIRVVYRILGL